MTAPPRLLVAGFAVAVAGVVLGMVLLAGGGDDAAPVDQPVAGRYAFPMITAIAICFPDYRLDPGIAPQAVATSESIDPGILAPTRDIDRYALRVVPEYPPCPEPTGTPTP